MHTAVPTAVPTAVLTAAVAVATADATAFPTDIGTDCRTHIRTDVLIVLSHDKTAGPDLIVIGYREILINNPGNVSA